METLEKQLNILKENIKENEEEIEEKNNNIEELETKIKRKKMENENLKKKYNNEIETLKNINEKIKKEQEEKEKNKENEIIELKKNNENIIKEKDKLNKEINSLKVIINTRKEDDIKKQELLLNILNKGYDEKDNLDELRKKNLYLRVQLKNNQETILKANDCIKKAKYFDNITVYGKILMQNFKPSNNEEIDAFNKLLFMFKDTANSNKNYKFDKSDINLEGVEKKKGFFDRYFN